MSRKYEVLEVDGFTIHNDAPVRTFKVFDPPDKYGWREVARVWADLDEKGAACIKCQGIVSAVSRTCPHARAVKRYLAKERKQSS